MSATDLQLGVSAHIYIDGVELDPLYDIEELRVEKSLDAPDRAVIRFQDAELKVIDDTKLDPGKDIELKIAPLTKPSHVQSLFKGVITTVQADVGMVANTVEVVATHAAAELQLRTTSRTLRNVTAEDAIKQVAATHAGTIDCPSAAYPIIHQIGETDWQFIARMARDHGCEVIMDGNRLAVRKIDAPLQDGPELSFDKNTLWRFTPRLSGTSLVDKVEVMAWDHKQKQVMTSQAPTKAPVTGQEQAVGEAKTGAKGGTITVRDRPAASNEEVGKRAVALAAVVGREAITAEALCAGDPALVPGVAVTIDGVGRRFGGRHRVVSVTHLVEGELGYQTRLYLGGSRPALDADGARRHRTTEQLVIGIVKNNKDPENLNRVKLNIPVFGSDFETDWARVAWGAAGKERGVVAPLDVDDEVLVGFEHGDASKPYVLGALFNGKDTPGAELPQAKDSLAARFPKDLDVKTAAKAIAEADKGMTLGSASGPVEVNAGGALKISAGKQGAAGMTLEATGQVKTTSQQGVEISAVSQLKLKSNASMAIESTGPLQIKGGIIQIQASGIVKISGATVMLG